MKQLLAITRALADNNRLRVLNALDRETELCACQITALLQVSGPTVSRHLTILQNAGLVDSRKQGRWVFYRLPTQPDEAVRNTLDWLREMRVKTADAADKSDAERLHEILQHDTEELCRKQRES